MTAKAHFAMKLMLPEYALWSWGRTCNYMYLLGRWRKDSAPFLCDRQHGIWAIFPSSSL